MCSSEIKVQSSDFRQYLFLPSAVCRLPSELYLTSSANPTNLETNALYVTPLASHSLGYMLVGVNPGMVLTSLR